jgi:hypothetical protein
MKTAQEIYEYHGGFTAKELADPGLCELRDRAFDLERENARLREVVADLARECDPVRNGIAAKYPELFLPNHVICNFHANPNPHENLRES